MTGRLIPHGSAEDPQGAGTAEEPHVAPQFPLADVTEYYKQLVPNAEATLPGSTCMTCMPQEVPRPAPGRRRTWRHSSSVSAGRSSRLTRSPESWVFT